MREILFRGKTTRSNIWVYGHYSTNYGTGRTEIREKAECCFVEVIPETVGQYTGLTDKNGKKIFEGDIVYDTIDRENALIVFENGSYYVKNHCIFMRLGESASVQIDVIGNIHDDHELLEGE